ncbi:DUF2165 domain-containing protein [uncultured Roseobacter sp.]|uniref:DUF2165 domain-containing protein n=1 Tax=uncultured Roseobacter sp. TaxID=114847 RepID=UPI0026356230|nr:DUF2165 domain-containing protein [uncultured Roseobacter sp.]
METALILAQTVATGLIAAWLTLGLRDNILHPSMNETYTAEVLSMARMKEAWPEDYKTVSYRAITDRSLQKLAFRLVVIAEAIACAILWAGVVLLILSLAGLVMSDTGRTVALLGATAFTAVWGGFLVVGNHFYYWYCHEGAQNTHYQMTLWGMGTMILISLA